MPHMNKPVIEEHDGKRYLKPYMQSGFGALLHATQDEAMQQAESEAQKYRETRYVVSYEDRYISVNHSGYFALFGDLPGDDVVY